MRRFRPSAIGPNAERRDARSEEYCRLARQRADQHDLHVHVRIPDGPDEIDKPPEIAISRTANTAIPVPLPYRLCNSTEYATRSVYIRVHSHSVHVNMWDPHIRLIAC